jgi:hypothetical protein
MARASLVFARSTPPRSSAVIPGSNFSSCAIDVIRFFNCQRQSSHWAGDTSPQAPRPADLNSLRRSTVPAQPSVSEGEPFIDMTRNYILRGASVK